jgi:hypothetical protein
MKAKIFSETILTDKFAIDRLVAVDYSGNDIWSTAKELGGKNLLEQKIIACCLQAGASMWQDLMDVLNEGDWEHALWKLVKENLIHHRVFMTEAGELSHYQETFGPEKGPMIHAFMKGYLTGNRSGLARPIDTWV